VNLSRRIKMCEQRAATDIPSQDHVKVSKFKEKINCI
jgi:hypothetical protein